MSAKNKKHSKKANTKSNKNKNNVTKNSSSKKLNNTLKNKKASQNGMIKKTPSSIPKENIKAEKKLVSKEDIKPISQNIELPIIEKKVTWWQQLKNKIMSHHHSNAKRIAKSKKQSDYVKEFKKTWRKFRMYGPKSILSLRNIAVIGSGIVLLLLLIVCIVILNSKQSVNKMDLDTIPSQVDGLKTISFNINNTNQIINDSHAYNSLKDYYEYDFSSIFNLNKDDVFNYVIRYNKTNKQVFIVIKANEGKENNIKEAITKFLATNSIKNYEYLEYDGYQFFINSANNTAVISKIKQSQIKVFTILKELKKADTKEILGIDNSLYSESLVKVSMISSDVCEYIIFKPSSNSNKKKIMNKMDEYYNDKISKWADDKDNTALLNNRLFKEVNGYLIYIVSYDNDLALQLIEN